MFHLRLVWLLTIFIPIMLTFGQWLQLQWEKDHFSAPLSITTLEDGKMRSKSKQLMVSHWMDNVIINKDITMKHINI